MIGVVEELSWVGVEQQSLVFLGIIEDDEEPRRNRERSTSPPALTNAGIDELTTRLHALSNQLESALAFSSTLQAEHTVAQSTISALEDEVSQLETFIRVSNSAPPPPPAPALAPAPTSVSELLTQMLAELPYSSSVAMGC